MAVACIYEMDRHEKSVLKQLLLTSQKWNSEVEASNEQVRVLSESPPSLNFRRAQNIPLQREFSPRPVHETFD
jgi:hypothetical protein